MSLFGWAIPPWVRVALRLAPYAAIGLLLVALLLTRATLANARLDAAKQLNELASRVEVNTIIAKTLDQQHALDVERQQAKVTSNVSTDYQRRLAALRARYDGLRASKAHSGGRGTADLPGLPDAPGGPDAAAPEAGLPPDDVLTASEQATQLDALQEWIRQQQAVPR